MQTELPRNLEDLIRLCRLHCWNVGYTAGGHIKITDSLGKWVATHSGTPGDYRAVNNFRADLKRAGLTPNPPKKKKVRLLDDPTEYFNMVDHLVVAEPPVSIITVGDQMTTETKKEDGRKVRGAFKNAILLALEVAGNPEKGLTPKEVYDLIKPDFPNKTHDNVGITLAYCVSQKEAMRPSVGHYRLAVKTEPKTPDPRVEVPSETDIGQTIQDMLTAMGKMMDQLTSLQRVVATQEKKLARYAKLAAALELFKEDET